MSPESDAERTRQAEELARELTGVLKKGLAETFKGPSRANERKFYQVAKEVRRLVPEAWDQDPSGALITVVRRAIRELPEGAPQDSRLTWAELAEILCGFADEEVSPKEDGNPLGYNDFWRYAWEESSIDSDRTFRRNAVAPFRLHLAWAILSLTPEDIQLYQQSPTESGQPTQVAPDDEPAPTTFPRDHQQTESGVTACAGVANVTAGSNASHRCPIREEVISSGPPERTAAASPRSSSPCPAAIRWRAVALSASTSASSCPEPTCSMLREPRREECTICTAVAPDAARTVRT